jgi:molecular chaperone DnaK (HSP70)
VLIKMKETAEAFIGQPVKDAVITVSIIFIHLALARQNIKFNCSPLLSNWL